MGKRGIQPSPVRDRLFPRLIIDPETGCLNWTASTTNGGYGHMFVPGRGMVRTHRLMWELFAGPIPDGMELDHLCRNPRCANVAHLEAVSHRENVLRGTSPSAAHARTTHCPTGHPYDEANTIIGKLSHGRGVGRWCRECKRARERRRYRARKQATS